MYNTLEFMLYLESYLHIGLHVKLYKWIMNT